MRVERLPYTDEDIALNVARFVITACGWCGGDPHDADDCPAARAFESQRLADIEAASREDG